MKLCIWIALAVLYVIPSYAEEVRHLKVHRDSALISEYDTHIKMTDVRYTEVSKTIRIVPARCTSDSESDCTRAEVLKKVPVVQVTVQYRDGVAMEENSYKTVDLELNLPVSKFTEDQIALLKEASRVSLTGRNLKIRKNFINDNLRLEITHTEKPTRVLDEERSQLCETEYIGELKNPGCKEDRKYKTQVIKYKHIKVLVNQLMAN